MAKTLEEAYNEADGKDGKIDKKLKNLGFCGRRADITIFNGPGENGKDDVQLQIVPLAINVKREQRVSVPEEFLEVLNNAREMVYDPKTGIGSEVMRFPYVRH